MRTFVILSILVLAGLISFGMMSVGTAQAAPVNDLCEDALPISDGDTPFSTVGALTDGPAHTGTSCDVFGFDSVGQDIWYNYTASCTGTLTVSTCNQANYDTKIAIYDGCDCPVSSSNLIKCNDDFPGCAGFTSLDEVIVVAGRCYTIRTGGFGGASGEGTLSVDCLPVPGVCTLDPQVCGNDIKEDCTVGEAGCAALEQCDGVDADACPGQCLANCTCPVISDSDGDGVDDPVDACVTIPGREEFQGCPAAILNDDDLLVHYHRAPGFACIDKGQERNNCTVPLQLGPIGDSRGEEVTFAHKKIFRLADLGASSYSEIKTQCADIYDGVAPFSGATPVNEADEVTSAEILGVPGPDAYVVIKRVEIFDPVDAITRIATICKPSNPEDFNHDFDRDGIPDPVAKRQLKLIKTVRTLKDGTIQVELKPAGDKKLRGSELAIVYPEIALWEEGVNDYVYPYFFTSSDNWTIDICTFAPEGYTIAGVYDELGDLMTITNCTQAGLAGETKVIAFETEKTGSPKKFKVKAEIEAAPKGKKGQKVTLETHSEIVKKGKLRRKKPGPPPGQKPGPKPPGLRAQSTTETGGLLCRWFGLLCR